MRHQADTVEVQPVDLPWVRGVLCGISLLSARCRFPEPCCSHSKNASRVFGSKGCDWDKEDEVCLHVQVSGLTPEVTLQTSPRVSSIFLEQMKAFLLLHPILSVTNSPVLLDTIPSLCWLLSLIRPSITYVSLASVSS